MIWCSGWKLASAVSNAGGLGLIGAGSMTADGLREHIKKCRQATDKPFGVNIPLIYQFADDVMTVAIEEGIKIIFTSAGNPKKWTPTLKAQGITVAHVVSGVKFAQKCEEAGVDAVVAEGFESGGHNSREETTTLTLVPMVRKAVSLPLIAAGGIATGRAMLAAMALGAEGVQIGTRFVASEESSVHPSFKQKIIETQEGETIVVLKKLIPVRLIKNKFCNEVIQAENKGASEEELLQMLGSGRPKLGMFDGNLDEGELEIGQISAIIKEIKPVAEIIEKIIEEFEMAKEELRRIKF